MTEPNERGTADERGVTGERRTSEWADERVLVTGGASFIGSHLVEDLLAAGAQVRVADDFSSGEPANLAAVRDEIELVEGNLKHAAVANEATSGIDTVFHLAAIHGGRGFIANYPADCATNMALDNTVFEQAVANGVDRISFASSACTYPTDIQRDRRRLREEMVSFDERGGAYADETYGWAKLMGERSLQAFEEQYDVDASIVRIFTAYGPRENETHAIIALLAKAYARQQPFEIWGDGEQTRNFTYVRDITRALRLAAGRDRPPDGQAGRGSPPRGRSVACRPAPRLRAPLLVVRGDRRDRRVVHDSPRPGNGSCGPRQASPRTVIPSSPVVRLSACRTVRERGVTDPVGVLTAW